VASEQLANTQANAAAFAGAKELATQYNDFMQQQVSKRLRETVPELEGLEAQASANFAKQLGGELSLSDAAGAQRKSAARALGLGVAGSPAGSALMLRDLGLTQYGVQQQAQQQLPGYLATIAGIKKAPLFDFSNVFLSPGQRIGFQFENATRRWNVQNLKNQMAVQPEPWMKSLAGFGDSILDAVAAYYTGGASAMGGGGSGGGKSNGFSVGDYQQQSAQFGESRGSGYGPPASSGYWQMFE
jgi:hypothetical protein